MPPGGDMNAPGGGTGWNQWAQGMLGRMFTGQPAPAAPQQLGTTTPAPTPTPAPQPAPSQQVDPAVDANGFPTNEEYLRSQGLNLVDANRALVETQQQQQELLQVLSDPQMRQQFFQEYDRALQQNAQNARPDYPGGGRGPDLYVPTSNQDVEYWWNHFQQLSALGLPPNGARLQRGQQLGNILQAWDEIPEEALINLVNYFPA